MPACVLAFAFGTPNTLCSNRRIAELAAQKARSLGIPIYTQRDVLPVEAGIDIELVEEEYQIRVPTLRIARGAVAWALARHIDVIWFCAANPHRTRCSRDLRYALREANARIELKPVVDTDDGGDEFWFCVDSTQFDTRYRWVWRIRDTVLLHMPMRLYAIIAG